MTSGEHRQRARQALKGNWGTAIPVMLVAGLLVGGSYMPDLDLRKYSDNIDFKQIADYLRTPTGQKILTVLGIVTGVATILAIVGLIIGGAVMLGRNRYCLDLLEGKKPRFSVLFSKFDMLGKGFGQLILGSIFIMLWSFLLIIPGIIKSYAYSMAFYIRLEHPKMTAMEALHASEDMMQGHKWELFCLQFSFIGWAFLSVLTLGIGMLWLSPYMETATASFYRSLSAKQTA